MSRLAAKKLSLSQRQICKKASRTICHIIVELIEWSDVNSNSIINADIQAFATLSCKASRLYSSGFLYPLDSINLYGYYYYLKVVQQ